MKKIIIAILLAIPYYIFAAPTAQRLYQQAEQATSNKDYKTALTYYQQAANMGDKQAQLKLGTIYLTGDDTKQGINLSEKWLTKASQQGNPNAKHLLGLVHLNDKPNLDINYPLAEKWLLASAKQNYIPAQQLLAHAYYQGSFGERNFTQAKYWFQKAAIQGNIEAKEMLGLMLLTGKGGKADTTQGLNWLTQAAIEEDHVAQFLLGKFYAEGSHGTNEDREMAKAWLKQAAKKLPEAKDELDKLMADDGTIDDPDNYIYTSHLDRSIVAFLDKDYDIAIAYSFKAYQQDKSVISAGLIATGYYAGLGVEGDTTKAATWFKIAAEQNNAFAQLTLGRMYLQGSVKQDPVKAYNWILKAAEQNNADAQITLGEMYAAGIGVKKDIKTSIQWLLKAAKNGHKEAIELLEDAGISI